MTLSDLLRYRDHVHGMTKQGSHLQAAAIIDQINTTVSLQTQDTPPLLSHCVHRIHSITRLLQQQLDDLGTQVGELDKLTQQCIDEFHDRYHSASKKIYQTQFSLYGTDKILGTGFDVTGDQRTLLRSRLITHSSWCDSGLIIRPANDDLVTSMSAMGILYLFDHQADMLAPAIARFPEHHRDKYRDYQGATPEALFQMPLAQMRLIFVQNFFNFMPWDIMQRYLIILSQLLRPGGTLIFTFNDCDHAVNVEFCERSWQCYQPARQVLAFTRSLGLEVYDRQWFNNGIAWVELQKLGKYRPLKGAPVLTKIHARSK